MDGIENGVGGSSTRTASAARAGRGSTAKVEVAALRGGPLGCGDLVRVVGTREEVRVVDVEWQGEMLPLVATARRVSAATG